MMSSVAYRHGRLPQTRGEAGVLLPDGPQQRLHIKGTHMHIKGRCCGEGFVSRRLGSAITLPPHL